MVSSSGAQSQQSVDANSMPSSLVHNTVKLPTQLLDPSLERQKRSPRPRLSADCRDLELDKYNLAPQSSTDDCKRETPSRNCSQTLFDRVSLSPKPPSSLQPSINEPNLDLFKREKISYTSPGETKSYIDHNIDSDDIQSVDSWEALKNCTRMTPESSKFTSCPRPGKGVDDSPSSNNPRPSVDTRGNLARISYEPSLLGRRESPCR